MKINRGVQTAKPRAPETGKAGSGTAGSGTAGSGTASEGLKQLEKFVGEIHAAVDAQAAALTAKKKVVPPALEEKKAAADRLLEAAKSGRSLSTGEIATQLNALLWELNPTELTQLHRGLETHAREFGELAKLQNRFLPGLPATLGSVVELLSGAAKVPTTTREVDRMLQDLDAALAKSAPEHTERLNAQKTLLLGLKARLAAGEEILRPMSLPTTSAGTKEAIDRVTQRLGEVHSELAALLGEKLASQLSPEQQTKYEALAAQAKVAHTELQTLETYASQLAGTVEPTALDRSGFLVGLSIGPAWDLAKWVPGFPMPVFGGVGAGLHLFEKNRATGERKLDWYGSANLQTPFGGGGYAVSPSKKGFSAAFNPPLGTSVGISLATHPFHGRKLDVFVPGLFRAEATSTGALAMTLFAPVPVPGVKVGLTVLVRNPVLANITGPILWVLDKANTALWKATEAGKKAAMQLWNTTLLSRGELAAPLID